MAWESNNFNLLLKISALYGRYCQLTQSTLPYGRGWKAENYIYQNSLHLACLHMT